MDKLEEMIAKFKDKTAGGLEFIILEVFEKGMQVVVRRTYRDTITKNAYWNTYHLQLDGVCSGQDRLSLVPIKPVIDYSKLPVDVLCEVRIGTSQRSRYSDGRGGFLPEGRDSTSAVGYKTRGDWDVIKIVENPIRANIGNTLALLPDNISLKVWLSKNTCHTGSSQMLRGRSDIIHYQILGES